MSAPCIALVAVFAHILQLEFANTTISIELFGDQLEPVTILLNNIVFKRCVKFVAIDPYRNVYMLNITHVNNSIRGN